MKVLGMHSTGATILAKMVMNIRMFAMTSMSMCNDYVNYDEIII